MDRRECEDELLRLLERAEAVYRRYDPEGAGFSLCCAEGQLEVIGYGGTLCATRFRDGEVWRMENGGNYGRQLHHDIL